MTSSGVSFRPGRLHDFIQRKALLEQRLALRLKRAGGADADALAAKYACCFRHWLVKEGADAGVKTAPVEVDRISKLRVVGTYLNTAPAQDAFGVVAEIHRIVIEHRILAPLGIGKARGVGAISSDKILDLRRLREIHGRREHLQDCPAAALGARARGSDLHAFARPAQTGRDKRLYAVDFDHADAAEPVGRAMIVVAYSGNLPSGFFRRLEDRRAVRNSDGLAVDNKSYISHKLPLEYWSGGVLGSITPILHHSAFKTLLLAIKHLRP